jgi:CRISPR-associated protein Cmr6
MTAYRAAIERLNLGAAGDHAGLALDKLLREHDQENKSKRALLENIAKIDVSSDAYQTAFKRWKDTLGNAQVLTATLKTPLAIGLGNATPLENGLSIHRTYGVPFLPGSALKGLAQCAAMRMNVSDEARRVLFGDAPTGRTSEGKNAGSASHLVYWDAWLEPESPKTPFQLDVITVHHPKYYSSSGDDGYPTDFDDPNPIAFVSVKPGARFCVAISSESKHSEPWIRTALELLKYGLENLGLGGKTNAGYGYFEAKLPERQKTSAERGAEFLEQHRATIASIKAAQDLSKADDLIKKLEPFPDAERRPTLEALREQLQRIKQWNLEKTRCQKIQSLLEES